MLLRLQTVIACLVAFTAIRAASGQDAVIHVDAAKVLGPVSPYLTGACIEDVNHEIYGGIDSQMVFGESFQEPTAESRIRGFKAFDGEWRLEDGVVLAAAGAGPKLVSDTVQLADGTVGVDIFLADRTPGNAGLIVRLSKPGVGADNFDGYEISLDPRANLLRLGRHRHDWQLLKDTPFDVPVGKWVRLEVKLTGDLIQASVDGKSVVRYEDADRPLLDGTIALRPWQRPGRYRNLSVKTADEVRKLPFERDRAYRGEVSGQWRPTTRGDVNARYALITERPFVGLRSQQIEFVSGQGEVGIENRGLNHQGMCFQANKPYDGYLWLRSASPIEVCLAAEDGDGDRRVAETRLQASGGNDWQRYQFDLTPNAAIERGRFVVALQQPGKVDLGHVFLEPGEWGRFKGLPDRRDVVEGLIEQRLTVLRYGGSMTNHPEYRWKKMIGPRDRRPPYQGTWYRYSTNGWGIIDFLNLCEAAGFMAIPAFNMGESPQDMADFIEYVNGSADRPWGRRRAEDGHPQPYQLRYIELGNEERVDDAYFERFRPLAETIWSKDKNIILVVGDFAYDHAIDDPGRVTGAASRITNLDAHRKLLALAKQAGREIDFDVHVWTEGPEPSPSLRALPSYVAALEKLADGAKHKVVVFEFNAGNHAFGRALANAGAINVIERLAGRVTIAASANCLQVDAQNDNGWNQGLLFMNPCRVWPQPPYFVTRMVAANYQPLVVRANVEGAAQLDVSAKRSDDGRTLVLQVVNTHDGPIDARLDIAGFTAGQPMAHVEQLTAALNAVNTADSPTTVRPVGNDWQHGLAVGNAHYTFPAMSFTVIRF